MEKRHRKMAQKKCNPTNIDYQISLFRLFVYNIIIRKNSTRRNDACCFILHQSTIDTTILTHVSP